MTHDISKSELAHLVELDAQQNPAAPLPLTPEQEAQLRGEFWVPAPKLDELKVKIGKLQRRALKLGAPEIVFDITGVTEERHTSSVENPLWKNGQPLAEKWTKIFTTFHQVTVKGEAPKFAGWRLVARLLHDTQTGIEGATIVNAVPGQTVPAVYRNSGCKCDHCNKNWIVRKDTYVLGHDDGTYKQVGATCIADFLGHQNPEQLAALYTYLDQVSGVFYGDDDDRDDQDDEPHGVFVRGATLLGLGRVLELVTAYTRTFGWTSRKLADLKDERPSSQVVIAILLSRKLSKDLQEIVDEIGTITDADKAKTTAAIEWAKALPESDSDFEHNLRTIANANVLSSRTLGIGCAIIGAYEKAIERKATGALAGRPESQHVGTEGVRAEFHNLTVVSVRTFAEGQYGPRVLHRFITEEGAILTWWTGQESFNAKDVVCVKATVKRHSDYKGTKQTELSRVQEIPSEEQKAILASLSPAAETLLSSATNGYILSLDRVPADEFLPAKAELEAKGWVTCEEDAQGKTVCVYSFDPAAERLVAFAKERKSKAQKSGENKAKKAAKAQAAATIEALPEKALEVLARHGRGYITIDAETASAFKAADVHVSSFGDNNDHHQLTPASSEKDETLRDLAWARLATEGKLTPLPEIEKFVTETRKLNCGARFQPVALWSFNLLNDHKKSDFASPTYFCHSHEVPVLVSTSSTLHYEDRTQLGELLAAGLLVVEGDRYVYTVLARSLAAYRFRNNI